LPVLIVKFEVPRGIRDLEADEFDEINYIREKFIEASRLFNFRLMEPAPLEMLGTLEAKAGPSISNEIYSLIDKGGRSIGLRFDLTIGLTRFVAARRDLRTPVKIAAFGGVWRYDEPQSGRYRYFHQCDIEIYGSQKLEADAEVVEFVHIFLKKLGLDVVIEINHLQLIEDFIQQTLGIFDEQIIAEVFRMMDKIPKRGPDVLLREYRGKINSSTLKKLIDFSSIKGNIQDVCTEGHLTDLENWNTIAELMDALRSRHIKNARINLGIVRGLDYYSGMVFEVHDPKTNVGALVGGGRYDKLTDIFGRKELGATGAAGGVERIIIALRQHNISKRYHKFLVYVAFASDDTKGKAIEIVSSLRNSGFITDYDIQGRPLRKQLDDASAKKASVTVIVAPKEIDQGQVIIKSMIDRTENIEDLKNLKDKLNDILVGMNY
jgi:histidyl-tRNA synthetase